MSRTAYLRFEQQLPADELDDLIKAMLSTDPADNRFHLWGGSVAAPTGVHVRGVDLPSWLPVSLEVSDRLAILTVEKGDPETEQEIIDRFASDLRRYLRQEISVEVDE